MVQRKTPDKLCIPAETKKNYVKSDKRSTTHKPASSSSSSHHQDIKNKGGTDLKTKLKKSRSLKLLDFESLESSPVKEEKSKTFKSPTADLSAATTPQRSSMIKASECSPNYMKSTSSSNARKERSPVISSRSSQTSSDSGNQKRNSNHSKSSSLSPDEEPAITKNTSLKPVRTLTKSSSMKSVKPLMKKGSGVALSQDLNAGRATCSSTLKDSKFPDYLMISPGGTESEGTSVMKVCPYTYCSLNGHHHAPLPPLKCFMSARRRSLRTQRSLRLRCLSPVGTKISAKTKKKIDTGQMDFDGDSAIVEADSTGSLISPQIEEIGMDFFVEIYAKPRENFDGLIIGRSEYDEDEKEKMDVTVIPEAQEDFLSSVKDGAETELEYGGKPSKSNSNESSLSEISFEDVLDQNSDFLLTEMDISEHNQQEEVEETEYPPYSEQAEADLECCCIGTKSESIVLVETELDESVAEASEMDWEEGEVVTQLVKDGSDSSNLTTGDLLQEAFEEKITNSDAETVDSESYGGDLILEIDVSSDTRGEGSIAFISVNKGQVSFTEDSSEEQTAISEEKDDDNEPEDFNSGAIFISSVEDPFAEVTSASEEKNEISETEDDFIQGNFLLEDDELFCTAEATDMNQKEEEDFQDDALIDQSLSLGNLDTYAEVGPQLSEPEDTSFLPEDELLCTAEATDRNQKEEEDFQDDATIDQSLSPGNLDINAEVGPQLSEPEDTSFLPEDDELCTAEATDRNQKEEEDFQDDALIDQRLSLGNLDINAEVGPQLSEPEDTSFLPEDDELFCTAEATDRNQKEEEDFQDDALIDQRLSLGNLDINAEVGPQLSEPEDTSFLPEDDELFCTAEATDMNQKEEEDFQDDATIDQSLSPGNLDINAEVGPQLSEPEDTSFLPEDDELFCTAEATDRNQKEEEDFQDDALIDQRLSLGNLDINAEVGPQLSEPEDTSFLPEDDELFCTAEATDRNQKEEEDFQDDALIDQRLSLGNLDINAEVGPQLSEPEDTSFLPEDDELFCTAEATDRNQKEEEDFQDDALIDQRLSLGNLDINAEVGPQLSEPEDTSFLPEDDELCTVEATDRNQKEEEDFQNDTLIDQSLSLGNLDINAEVGPQLSEPVDISCTIGSQTFEAVISKTDQDLATSDISMDQSLPTADDGVGAEEMEQVDQDSGEKYNNESAQMHTEIEVSQCEPTQEDDKCGTAVETLLPPTQGESYDDESSSSSMVENQELPAKDQREGMDLSFSSSTHAEEHNDPESYKLVSAETGIIEDIQVEGKVVTDTTEMCLTQNTVIGGEEKKKMINARRVSHQQVTENSCSNLKISIRRKEQHIEKREELREFNPREPNYLDVVPDPEAEKVDLKQQMMDERKNSEEWMLDYALRKAVNELAPARKRRVALLVEAFETVTPQPKCESRIRHVMPVFSHTRPMQACI